MSDNTLVVLIVTAMIAGCSTCSVSKNRKEVEIERIKSVEKLEIIKNANKPKP